MGYRRIENDESDNSRNQESSKHISNHYGIKKSSKKAWLARKSTRTKTSLGKIGKPPRKPRP